MSSFKAFDIAGSGMAAQSVRLNTTASNLANADSVSGTADERLQAAPSDFRSGTRAARGARTRRRRSPRYACAASTNPRRRAEPALRAGQSARRRQRLRVRAGGQRGGGDGQHDLRLAFLPEQRRSHEHLQRPAAGHAAARTRLITMLDMDIINAAMVRQTLARSRPPPPRPPMRRTPRRPSSIRTTS